VSVLAWEGCLNVRDLGGHATEDGVGTRHGVIVRADALGRLSDAGWDALVAYGITRIVDLRLHDEREADPPRDLPAELVHVQLVEIDEAYRKVLNRHLDSAADAAEYIQWSYLDFLERFSDNFVAAVRAVATAPGPALVHCVGGKDRTGLVVALLLRLAGVSRADIDADYAVSEGNLDDQPWVDEAPDEVEAERRRKIIRSPEGVMAAVLAELERRHGTVRQYLLGAGSTTEELDAIRTRLRG
jgi:protein tyrosine/serine phosphatase